MKIINFSELSDVSQSGDNSCIFFSNGDKSMLRPSLSLSFIAEKKRCVWLVFTLLSPSLLQRKTEVKGEIDTNVLMLFKVVNHCSK